MQPTIEKETYSILFLNFPFDSLENPGSLRLLLLSEELLVGTELPGGWGIGRVQRSQEVGEEAGTEIPGGGGRGRD